MAVFGPVLARTLAREGCDVDPVTGLPVPGGAIGYTDDPKDSGGETCWGITEANARHAGWTGPMREIPYDFAAAWYRREFWDKIMGDDQPDQEIADTLFDCAVNQGRGTAVRHIQIALNVLNHEGTKWPDIVEDGGFGPSTLAAMRACLALGPSYRTGLARAVTYLKGARAIAVCRPPDGNPKNERFVRGWLLR